MRARAPFVDDTCGPKSGFNRVDPERFNSPGLWPLGVLDPSSGLFLVLYLVLCTFVPGIRARKGAALGPRTQRTIHSPKSRGSFAASWALAAPIFPIF